MMPARAGNGRNEDLINPQATRSDADHNPDKLAMPPGGDRSGGQGMIDDIRFFVTHSSSFMAGTPRWEYYWRYPFALVKFLWLCRHD